MGHAPHLAHSLPHLPYLTPLPHYLQHEQERQQRESLRGSRAEEKLKEQLEAAQVREGELNHRIASRMHAHHSQHGGSVAAPFTQRNEAALASPRLPPKTVKS